MTSRSSSSSEQLAANTHVTVRLHFADQQQLCDKTSQTPQTPYSREPSRTTEALCQQDRLQLLAEKRKWQTEIENKKRQLEDDRRALQHLKSKALRERWLLDGAPSAGPEQDEVKRQLEQDEAKSRSLEETINRSNPV
ncbi:hypothetical protein PAMP_024053 [Pampus punctatissimus]